MRLSKYTGVLGINIGKNKDTPISSAADDYLLGLESVYPVADYVTINLSSPNTPGLRHLQSLEPLDNLLGKLTRKKAQLVRQHQRQVPLVVKLAPDIALDAIPELAAVIVSHQIEGVIATNTTTDRDMLGQAKYSNESGGLSGAPLKYKANLALSALRNALPDSVTLIGTGGICDGVPVLDLNDGMLAFPGMVIPALWPVITSTVPVING